MQDRYHNLLKRRLQSEIQRHPPLFPWETELSDYEATESASFISEQTNPAPLWITQLRQFELPVTLPERVLSQLLELCQSAAQTTLLEGAKIVQAVESLFPGQGSTLNQLAQVVMMSPVRSGGGTQLPPAVQQHLPQSYETANSVQQMLLSLLAAREIVSSLTIQVSSEASTVERQWQTERGPLLLEVQYQPQETSRLRVQVWFPVGGSLKLFSQSSQSVAQRSTSGYGSAELFEPQLQQNHLLEIQLDGSQQPPLVFSIQLTPAQG
ncbi:MAG: hypothetical protein SFW36_14365 [Leptolyngbyaceae cyanobacterium bins.59]|nr:hypothetical protein [Leptolyngbyaceae cyanobacterium bins.59]